MFFHFWAFRVLVIFLQDLSDCNDQTHFPKPIRESIAIAKTKSSSAQKTATAFQAYGRGFGEKTKAKQTIKQEQVPE
jgi:hypothetical protein